MNSAGGADAAFFVVVDCTLLVCVFVTVVVVYTVLSSVVVTMLSTDEVFVVYVVATETNTVEVWTTSGRGNDREQSA